MIITPIAKRSYYSTAYHSSKRNITLINKRAVLTLEKRTTPNNSWRDEQSNKEGESQFEEEDNEEEQQRRRRPNQNNQRRHRNRRKDDLGGIKIKVPSFKGKSDLEAYLEWKMRVDQIFSCQSYSKGNKVKLATLEFTNYVLVWWDQMQKERARYGERPLRTWEEIKAIMRRRFVSSYFHKELHDKLQRLYDDYHKEMEMTMVRANILEDQEATMARFLNGLNRDITDNNSKKEVVGSHSKVVDSKKNQIETNLSKNQDMKCFKCLGRGHITSQCPNKRTMIMKDNGEVEIERKDDNEELPHDGDLLVVRKVLNMQEKGKDESQRENIFHTRCLVQGKDFQYVFPYEVSSGLPPIREIEHHINLITGATLPIRPTYRSNPNETKEIQKQVNDNRPAYRNRLASWEECLPDVDFAYNRVVHSTTNHSPFEVVYDFNPLTPLDLILLSMHKQVHQDGKKKTEYVRQLHEKVKQQIVKKTRQYANQADKGHKKLLQRFGLTDMAHTIDKILAGADRESIDVFECFQPPQDIREAELIPRKASHRAAQHKFDHILQNIGAKVGIQSNATHLFCIDSVALQLPLILPRAPCSDMASIEFVRQRSASNTPSGSLRNWDLESTQIEYFA
ncbi:hypothetical protein CR513_11536, partial [Mucuna pruriens]